MVFLMGLVMFFLLIGQASASDCYARTISVLYLNGQLQDKPVSYRNVGDDQISIAYFTPGQGYYYNFKAHFEVHNNLDITLGVVVRYAIDGTTKQQNSEIPPNGDWYVSEDYTARGKGFDTSSIEFDYVSSGQVEVKREKKNCMNSPVECVCPNYETCNENAECVDDCQNPPEGKKCCGTKFVEINSIENGMACNCDFECKGYDSGSMCSDHKCQSVFQPVLKCSSNRVEVGNTIKCSIYTEEVKLLDDANFVLGIQTKPELSFSFGNSCKDIELRKCSETFSIKDINNNNINIDLKGIKFGKSEIKTDLDFEYGNKKMKTELTLPIDVYGSGNGIKDEGETEQTCCTDVPLMPQDFFSLINQKCDNGKFTRTPNLSLISSILVVCLAIWVIYANFSRDNKKGE